MKKEVKIILAVCVFLIIAYLAYITIDYLIFAKKTIYEPTAYQRICTDECSKTIASGKTLNSECLLNPINGTDWVCEVAHSPRTADDSKPENQCSAYPSTAKHFVEVTPECAFVRAV